MALGVAGAVGAAVVLTSRSFLGKPMPGNRLAKFRFLSIGGAWTPPNHTPSELLRWATELQPDVFWRTFSMGPRFSLDAPLPEGYTVGSFLDALAAAAGGYHTPRIDVTPGIYTDDEILALSKQLLDMPLTPKLRFLSIDNYATYLHQNGAEHTQEFFHRVFNQGWSGLDFLVCGSGASGVYTQPPPTYGLASTVGFQLPAPAFTHCAIVMAWDTNTTCRDRVSSANPGARLFMELDAPAESDCFKQLTPDEMASVLSQVAVQQAEQSFTFVWPIIQETPDPTGPGQWDSTQYVLRDGRTLFDVERWLMTTYNPKA